MIDLMRIRVITISATNGRCAAEVARTVQRRHPHGREGENWTRTVAIHPDDAPDLKVGDLIEVDLPTPSDGKRDPQPTVDTLTFEERMALADLVEGRERLWP